MNLWGVTLYLDIEMLACMSGSGSAAYALLKLSWDILFQSGIFAKNRVYGLILTVDREGKLSCLQGHERQYTWCCRSCQSQGFGQEFFPDQQLLVQSMLVSIDTRCFPYRWLPLLLGSVCNETFSWALKYNSFILNFQKQNNEEVTHCCCQKWRTGADDNKWVLWRDGWKQLWYASCLKRRRNYNRAYAERSLFTILFGEEEFVQQKSRSRNSKSLELCTNLARKLSRRNDPHPPREQERRIRCQRARPFESDNAGENKESRTTNYGRDSLMFSLGLGLWSIWLA